MLCTCIHIAACDVLYKKQRYRETDVTERRESSAKADAEELDEEELSKTRRFKIWHKH